MDNECITINYKLYIRKRWKTKGGGLSATDSWIEGIRLDPLCGMTLTKHDGRLRTFLVICVLLALEFGNTPSHRHVRWVFGHLAYGGIVRGWNGSGIIIQIPVTSMSGGTANRRCHHIAR